VSLAFNPTAFVGYLYSTSGEGRNADCCGRVLGTVAELDRGLIAERVRAGIRHVGAKERGSDGRRSPWTLPESQPYAPPGHASSTICRETGMGKGTAQRAFSKLPRVPAPSS